MDKTTTGWVTFIAALGMMCGLLASDVAKLPTWDVVLQPSFVAVVMSHFAVVVLAFVGGKLIPEPRDPGMKTRADDVISQAVSQATLTQINKDQEKKNG